MGARTLIHFYPFVPELENDMQDSRLMGQSFDEGVFNSNETDTFPFALLLELEGDPDIRNPSLAEHTVNEVVPHNVAPDMLTTGPLTELKGSGSVSSA